MLSIIRRELLEEPIAYDDPVPGTQCYFMETPARLCPFVIMDIGTKTIPERREIRECYYHDDLENCPVLTYGYPPSLLFMAIPGKRWRQLGMDRDRDDYEIVWPDDTLGRLYIKMGRSIGLPPPMGLGRRVHGWDWEP